MSDQRQQMREWFPVPADRDLPPGRHLLHRENLMAQIRNEPPASSEPPRDRPSARRVLAWHPSARSLAAAAAAVVLAAGLGTVAADRFSSRPAPAASIVTATAVLDRIAQAAAAVPALTVRPDQYFYVKAHVTGSSNFVQSGTVEGWVAQSQSRETLWRDNGHSLTLQTGTLAAQGVGGPLIGIVQSPSQEGREKLLYPSYDYLESLPTNPQQLLNLIQHQVSTVGRSDIEAFLLIGQLLSAAVLPPQTAAALYRAAALIPKVTVVPNATDALGRHGIGIAYSWAGDYHDDFRLREEWVFSSTTYQFLGARTSMTSPSANNREVTQTSASAVLARGIADSPGGSPTLIK